MAEAAAKEPTMEDILSSIRKIIAEEGEDKGPDDDWRDFQAEADVPVEPEVKTEPGMAEPAPVAMPEEQVAAEVAVEPVASIDTEATEMHQNEPQQGMVAGSLAQIAAGMRSPTQSQPVEPAPVSAEAEMPASATMEEDPIEVTQTTEDSLVDRSEAEDFNANSQMVTRTLEEVAEVAQNSAERQTVQIEEQPVAEAPAIAPQSSPSQADVHMGDASHGPQAEIGSAETNEASEANAFKGALMSPGADGAVSGSFDRLKRSMMDDIEAKTESILRPMLREWLDENLPGMVEKLVREEIERVARGS